MSVRLHLPPAPELEVSALWLRDNCPCSACRIEATSEHRLVISDLPIDLEPVSVIETDVAITVDWGDHRSVYDTDWLVRTLCEAERSHPESTPWPSGFEPMRFDHRSVLAERDVELAMLGEFAASGTVILTDTPTEPGSLEGIIRRWAPPIEVPFDLIHDVYVNVDGYNVAHSAEALPPHNDMAGQHQPPSGQVLHMLVNTVEGGRSILVDGLAVAGQLDPADIDLLCSVPVSFRQFSCEVETWHRAPVLRRNAAGALEQIRYSNQLLQPLDPRHPSVDDWYRAYHRLSAALADPDRQAHFRLDGGDLLMVHGHRVLHGRMAFEASSGRRHLQDIYFEFEDVMNEYWRLCR